MSPKNPPNNPVNQTISVKDSTISAEEASVLEEENVKSIQKTVVAEANAVLASNRKRDPVVTMMHNGIQRIDF